MRSLRLQKAEPTGKSNMPVWGYNLPDVNQPSCACFISRKYFWFKVMKINQNSNTKTKWKAPKSKRLSSDSEAMCTPVYTTTLKAPATAVCEQVN